MISKMFYDQKTPCHIIDITRLRNNIEILLELKKRTSIKMLFAVKGFSNDRIIPLFIDNFDGISASGLWEARLGKELFKKTVHTFSSAYKHNDYSQINKYSDFIIFNSINQLNEFLSYSKNKNIGIRINPGYSTVKKYKIDPCHQYSRFGVNEESLSKLDLKKINGIHFHSMCEQYSPILSKTLDIVGDKFDYYLSQLHWINIGGGQLYTDFRYNRNEAIDALNQFQKRFDTDIYAEPCETVLLNSGYTVASVIDIVHNGIDTVILDLSAICNLPDIVNSPYRCKIYNADFPNKKPYSYRICGCTCYAGDIFGDYSFDQPLEIGTKLVFLDTASYSMVKNNYFNGINPPSYILYEHPDRFEVVKEYGYNTFLSVL